MKRALIVFVVFTTILIFIMKDRLYMPQSKKNMAVTQNSISTRMTADNTDMSLSDPVSSEIKYRPLNFEPQKAMWFTYMDYNDILSGKTKEEFTAAIRERFKTVSVMGINTVYVQVRAFCDAYYKSDLFPAGSYYTDTSFDPLEIIISEGHSYGLSVHAWINPLRCMTDEQLLNVSDQFIIKKWYNDTQLNGKYIVNHEGRWYLNPAYDEVVKYVCDGVREIVKKYNADGVHIDDYFYPFTDPSFDSQAFSESGITDLGEFRRGNTDKLVKAMYDQVKSENSNTLFGISPQGNIDINLNSQYADVRKWTAQNGFCDYIVPQLYYGYQNETCPFEQTMNEWASLERDSSVRLIIGVCTYKIGTEDKWAGAGKNEWIDNPGLTVKQVEDSVSNDNTDGVAIYSYASTFITGESSAVMAESGVQNIREVLKDYGVNK